MFFGTYIFAEKHVFFVRPLLEHGVYEKVPFKKHTFLNASPDRPPNPCSRVGLSCSIFLFHLLVHAMFEKGPYKKYMFFRKYIRSKKHMFFEKVYMFKKKYICFLKKYIFF